MILLPIRNILRLSLAISVSLWMAGAGCLFGCSKETHASSTASIEFEDSVVAEQACSSSSHDCCAKKQAQQESTTANSPHTDLSASQVRPAQSSMMESCPMAVNASAIVSKGRAEPPKASIAKTIEPPLPSTALANYSRDVDPPRFHNRGPTYLRCCSFLI